MTSSRDFHRLLVALALTCAVAARAAAAAAGAAGTPGDDPLQTPECRAAIASLQAREAQAGAAARSGDATVAHAPSVALLAARRDAARRCLASRADPPIAPGRPIRSPVVVAPIDMPATAGPIAAGRAASIAPSRAPITGPRTVTSCDAGGCWTSDGARVDRFGGTLWDRRGACTLSGTVLQCP